MTWIIILVRDGMPEIHTEKIDYLCLMNNNVKLLLWTFLEYVISSPMSRDHATRSRSLLLGDDRSTS